MRNRHLRLWIVVLLLVATCVGFDRDDEDPRLGELGRVRFSGGGGCNNSTILAVGSTATLTLEPQHSRGLPTGLAVSSTQPEVFSARDGDDNDQVVLHAYRSGEAHVELHWGGHLYDRLGFSAEPAASLTYDAPAAVLAGGTHFLKVNEVYGACGQDCPLIGGGFLVWASVPEGTFTVKHDAERTTLFSVGDAADAHLIGREPTSGVALIDHLVAVIKLDSVGELTAMVVVMLPDQTLLDPQPPPVELPVGSLLQVQLQVRSTTGVSVPIARLDAQWTVEGDTEIVEVYPLQMHEAPEGPIFGAQQPGRATIVADVSLLQQQGRFELVVTSQ